MGNSGTTYADQSEVNADKPELSLVHFLRIVRSVFAVLAAQRATSGTAESYRRLSDEAARHSKALDAQLELDADWVAEAYDDHLRDLTNRYFE